MQPCVSSSRLNGAERVARHQQQQMQVQVQRLSGVSRVVMGQQLPWHGRPQGHLLLPQQQVG
jgi:hypothetical protein